jgi:hypothetical protein
MTQAPIQYSEIRDAFDFVSFGQPMEHEAYLCLETGKCYWHSEIGDNEEPLPEDIDDAGKYVAVPHKTELGLGTALVMRFVNEHIPELHDKVREIFSRSGAYARFKDLLEYRGALEQWYEYEETASEHALRQWCKDNNIEIVG